MSNKTNQQMQNFSKTERKDLKGLAEYYDSHPGIRHVKTIELVKEHPEIIDRTINNHDGLEAYCESLEKKFLNNFKVTYEGEVSSKQHINLLRYCLDQKDLFSIVLARGNIYFFKAMADIVADRDIEDSELELLSVVGNLFFLFNSWRAKGFLREDVFRYLKSFNETINYIRSQGEEK